MQKNELCGFIYYEHCAYAARTGDTKLPSKAELYPNEDYEEKN